MPPKVLLSIIIPCYNEELNIRRFDSELIPDLEALKIPYEIVLVDDGSTDKSPEVLAALASRLSLRLLRHATNLGMGAALRTGFTAAQGEWIVTMDADLTFAPAQIKNLLACQKATDADLVSGSPFLSAESNVCWRRRLPSLCINKAYQLILSPSLTAYTPVFRLYRAQTLKTMPLESVGFEINVEVAAHFILAGQRVAEIPAALQTRHAGLSKLNERRELWRHLRLMLKLLCNKQLKLKA